MQVIEPRILEGHVLDVLKSLPSESVQLCLTSPPYWGLRAYGTEPQIWGGNPDCDHEWADTSHAISTAGYSEKSTLSGFTNPDTKGIVGNPCVAGHLPSFCVRCSAWRGELGQEPTYQLFIDHLVEIFREVRRVLRKDGLLFCNLGDSYAGSVQGVGAKKIGEKQATNKGSDQFRIPAKNLVGIPWRTALALQADGWYLRSDIIWCLSGGTYVYAKTQKGITPCMVRDLARLDPSTVELWNGERWTRLLGMSKSSRNGDELEIVLRSGERISCTPMHKFPTQRGLLEAQCLVVGDKLQHCQLPEPDDCKDCVLDEDAAWLAGLYIAEGSRSGNTIQIAGHVKEEERWDRLQRIAAKFGGSATRSINGNCMDIRVYGKILSAIIEELVTGHTAKDKGFSPVVWRYSNKFVDALLDGYLSGDGSYEAQNRRWRLGFARNYNLERDLRIACARLGYTLVLNAGRVPYEGRMRSVFKGELRKVRSGHHNERDMGEIVEVRKARCREVYDIGVADEPHIFALASGILTHNSKPNVMPESVTDRPTRSHEYIFMLAKSPRYFYDQDAIREPHQMDERLNGREPNYAPHQWIPNGNSFGNHNRSGGVGVGCNPLGRNKRSVWSINTQPFSEAHFATWPSELAETIIKAGTSEKGCCPACGSPWKRVIERTGHVNKREPAHVPGKCPTKCDSTGWAPTTVATSDWEPSCKCGIEETIPCTVLDCFGGSGTSGKVATSLGRNSILIELNPQYANMARNRTAQLGMSLL
jgi:DNA modification methylase